MEDENKKQLIILGNGFDLACGLKSSYANFFEQRFEKAKPEEIVKTLQKHKLNNQGSVLNLEVYGLWDQKLNTFNTNCYHKTIGSKHNIIERYYKATDYNHKINYFDLLFMAAQVYMDSDDLSSWSNIEQILQEILQIIYEEADGAIFNDKEELNNKAKELEEKCFKNYAFKSKDAKINLIKFILHIFNKTTVDNKIKKALEQYEEIFGRFITNEIEINKDKYFQNIQRKLTQLTEKEAYILNFNYSATSLLDDQILETSYLSNLIKAWVNIHGLSRWNSKSRIHVIQKCGNNNIRLPRPIFGISQYDEDKNNANSIYQFTKMKRREDAINLLGFKSKEDDIKILDFNFNDQQEKIKKETHFTVPSDINLITIFGHSLGTTDWNYFKDIFEKVDLAHKDVKLEIYYHGNNLPSLKKSLNRILQEYSGNNLYNTLYNKGLLSFRDTIGME